MTMRTSCFSGFQRVMVGSSPRYAEENTTSHGGLLNLKGSSESALLPMFLYRLVHIPDTKDRSKSVM